MKNANLSLLDQSWSFVRSRLQNRDRWKKTGAIFSVAIVGTWVGDNIFQLVSGELFDLSSRAILWRGLVAVVCVLAVASGIEEIINIFRRSKSVLDVSSLDERKLTSTPALIVIASASADPIKGPHWTAYQQFVKEPDSPLRHVFVIHSDHSRSKASATAIEDDIKKNHPNITVWTQGLETDFEDPEKMFSTTKTAIMLAAAQEDVGSPDNVILDATGGTAMASIGAALAKLENPGVILGYIPNNPDGTFGTVVKRVQLEIEPKVISAAAQSDS